MIPGLWSVHEPYVWIKHGPPVPAAKVVGPGGLVWMDATGWVCDLPAHPWVVGGLDVEA